MANTVCWYLMAEAGNIPIEMLMDTRASITLLDHSLYDTFVDKPPLRNRKVALRTANGEQMRVYGEIDLSLVLNGQRIDHPTLVCDLAGTQAILGIDLMDWMHGLIDTRDGMLYLLSLKTCVELHKVGQNMCARISVTETIHVPPRSESIAWGRTMGNRWDTSEVMGVVEPLAQFNRGRPALLGRAVVDASGKEVPLPIVNLGGEPIIIHKGEVVAIMRPVETLSISSSTSEDSTDLSEAVPTHLEKIADLA